MTASNNRPTIRFVAEYFHDGAWWDCPIYAYDWPDAETRCKKLGLQLLGEFKFSVPAIGRSTWLPNLLVRFRNLLAQS